MQQINFYEYLYNNGHMGKENACSVKKFMNDFGFNNPRQVRRMIAQERESGKLICSNNSTGGFYLPKNNDEIRETLSALYSYIFSMLKIAKTFKNWLDIVDEYESGYIQTELEDFIDDLDI